MIKSASHYFRVATGEAWPDIMLDATSGRDCDMAALDFNKTILENEGRCK